MSTLTAPAIARANTRLLHEALAEKKEFLPGEPKELVQLCDFIAGLFRGFLQGVNESMAEGVGSRSLRAKLTEGITTAAESIEECGALQERLDIAPHAPEKLSQALASAIAEMERVHGELLTLAAWVDSPPPLPPLEQLLEASKGPFSRMRN